MKQQPTVKYWIRDGVILTAGLLVATFGFMGPEVSWLLAGA